MWQNIIDIRAYCTSIQEHNALKWRWMKCFRENVWTFIEFQRSDRRALISLGSFKHLGTVKNRGGETKLIQLSSRWSLSCLHGTAWFELFSFLFISFLKSHLRMMENVDVGWNAGINPTKGTKTDRREKAQWLKCKVVQCYKTTSRHGQMSPKHSSSHIIMTVFKPLDPLWWIHKACWAPSEYFYFY